MKRRRLLTHVLTVLACLAAAGIADDAPAPAAPAPGVNVQIQIQGGVQLQIQGGGQLQFQAGGLRVQAAVAADAGAAPQIGQPPVIFFPGNPLILLPNPAVKANAKPGYLGVRLDTQNDEQPDDPGEKKEREKENAGVGILSVVEDSPASKAGLQEGDRVLTFEGKKAANSNQLREMIRATRPEQVVKLTVRRDGKEMEIKATLGGAPEFAAGVQMLGGNVFFGQNAPEAVPGVVTFNRTFVRSSTPTNDKDIVSLRDGNRFPGKIRGIDPVKGLTLQREGLPDLDLLVEEISSLTFADREKIAAAPAKVHLQLRDGSWFNGDALTLEHGTLLLTLPGGQRMEIPMEQAQSATLSNEQAPQIYDGPTGLAGWTSPRTGQGQWEYRDGFLRCISNGPIARNFERMPDPLDLSFDVISPAMMQHFGVTLFGGSVNQTGTGALTLQFSPNQIFGSHFDGRRSNQYNVEMKAAEARFGGFDPKPQSFHYRLLVDRVNGRALIYTNGIKRADWKLSKVKAEEIGKCGATFSFSPNIYSSTDQAQLGRIRLLPWDGKEPANGGEPAAPKADQVLAGDGTVVNGTIEKISAEEIALAHPQGTARRDRTLYVRFAAPSAPKEQPAAVALLRLKNGSEFAAMQVRGGGDTMTFTTRFDSQITLPLSALRELDFLPRPGQLDPATKGVDVLTLTDGTQLKGRVLIPIEGGTLRWKIAASKTPLEFPSARVAGVFFSPAKHGQETPALKGSSVVRLGNGDWLPGDVVSLDARQLVMKTSLTPELIVPLAELRGLYLNPDVASSVSDGATGRGLWTDGWNPNRANMTRQQMAAAAKSGQPWMYHDGGYALTGASRSGTAMLARKWPAYAGAYAVNLEMPNTGRSAAFHIQLYNSRDERTFTVYCIGGRVNVYFNPGSARLNRFGGGGKNFQTEAKADPGSGNVRVSVVLDRPAKTFRVFMAGKEIGKIAFKENEATEALDVGGISLTPMSSGLGSGGQGRIAGIWLAPWDAPPAKTTGPADKKEAGAAGAEPAKDSAPEPAIYLANGDEFTGAIEKISAGVVTVNSEAGPLELPGKRVAWIHFPGPDARETKHFPRLRFHDSGVLSVQDLHIENERVKCRTMQGQALEFPLSLVKEVVWRPLTAKE